MNTDVFNNYYLLKCFENQKYRDDFNNGKNIYLNSTNFFEKVENEFQNDKEGIVFEQSENENSYLITDDEMQKLLADNLIEVDYDKKLINLNMPIKQLKNVLTPKSEDLCIIKDFKLSIMGYICCFYLIPKYYVEFKEQQIVFNKDCDKRQDFFYFLNKYSKKNGYSFVSVYDAKIFIDTFTTFFNNKGYCLAYGAVKYDNISYEDRIKYFRAGNIEKIIFTKNKEFSYQK